MLNAAKQTTLDSEPVSHTCLHSTKALPVLYTDKCLRSQRKASPQCTTTNVKKHAAVKLRPFNTLQLSHGLEVSKV